MDQPTTMIRPPGPRSTPPAKGLAQEHPVKRAAWAAPDLVVKGVAAALVQGPVAATAITGASLPATAINLQQAWKDKQRGIGNWGTVAANALNLGVGVAATATAAAGLIEPSLQTASMVALGASVGANLLAGAVNYTTHMGATQKTSESAQTMETLQFVGKQVRGRWKEGLMTAAAAGAIGAAVGAVAIPAVVGVAAVGMNVVAVVLSTAVSILTAGFYPIADIVMPNLANAAVEGSYLGALTAAGGLMVGLFPGLKESVRKTLA